MHWNSVVCKNGKPFLSPSIWAKTNKSTALFGPLASPRRYANLPGMFATLCLAKVSLSSQIFPPLAWQCSRVLVWKLAGIFSQLAACSKLQDCFGLEHFLSWKQKKEQYFFERLVGNNSEIGVPSLQQNRPALVKSLEPVPGLSFYLLEVLSWAGVPGRDTSTLVFPTVGCSSMLVATITLGTLWFGLASLGVKAGTVSG